MLRTNYDHQVSFFQRYCWTSSNILKGLPNRGLYGTVNEWYIRNIGEEIFEDVYRKYNCWWCKHPISINQNKVNVNDKVNQLLLLKETFLKKKKMTGTGFKLRTTLFINEHLTIMSQRHDGLRFYGIIVECSCRELSGCEFEFWSSHFF